MKTVRNIAATERSASRLRPTTGDSIAATDIPIRTRVLPVGLVLTPSFDGKEDRGLYDTLVTELPGMLNWSLEGRDRLYKRGYFIQPDSGKERLQQLADLARPESSMLRDCTEMKPGGILLQGDLFQVCECWCCENGITHSGTAQTFARHVHTAWPGLDVARVGPRGNQERYWKGLRLKPEWAQRLLKAQSAKPAQPEEP